MNRADRVDPTRLSPRARIAAIASLLAMTATLALSPTRGSIPLLEDAPFRVAARYHDPDSLDRALHDLARTRPDRARYRLAGRSVEGRAIGGIEVGTRDPAAPSIFVSAGLHGREWTTHVLALNLARQLLHPRCAALMARLRVCVVPLANPDGYLWSRTARRPQGPDDAPLWRKSRRPIGAGRLEAVGIDLNRNFDVDWSRLGSSEPGSNDYRGAHAGSEPEVAALQQLILFEPRAFGLDLHSGAPYQIHAPSRLDRRTPFGAEVVRLAVTLRAAFRAGSAPRRFGIGRGDRFVFEASPGGQTVNFLHHRAGAQAFTVEIGRFFDGATEPERRRLVTAWVESILAAFEAIADGPGVCGRVVDAVTGRPIVASVRITDLDDEEPHVNRLAAPLPTSTDGRFSRYLVPGRYRIEASAAGYRPAVHQAELRRSTEASGGWSTPTLALARNR